MFGLQARLLAEWIGVRAGDELPEPSAAAESGAST